MERCMNFLKIVFLLIFGSAIVNQNFATELVKKPNILFITIDDLKPALGCYGDKFAKTPQMDQLAKSAFVFKNNYCQQAVCSSSRASFLTGKRPDYTMVWGMNTLLRNMISNIVTLPQLFKENGYKTAAIGKVFDSRSVDQWHDSLSWSIPYQQNQKINPKGDGWVFAKESLTTEAPDIDDSRTLDGEILADGIRQLNQFAKNENPFFLAIGFQKPHLPFIAPKKYWDLYNRNLIKVPDFQEQAKGTPEWVYETPWNLSKQYTDVNKKGPLNIEKQKELIHGYYACVSFIDQQIGIIINHLKEKGLYDKTIIVVCSDQGMHLGDHGIWCIHSNLDEITRTPLIISYGSRYVGKTNSPTELLDIFPTLCEITGIDSSEKLDGQSLLPIMNGSKKSVIPFAVSQIQRLDDYMGYAFRDERFRYVVWLKNDFRSYMSYRKELIVGRELYDYQADPEETKNVINQIDYAKVVQKFESWSVNFFMDQEKSHSNGAQFTNE